MSVGRFKKRHAIITSPEDIYSDGIPVTLADGQVAKWGIPLNQDMRWIKDLVDGFIKTESDANTLRFLVFPTHGVEKAIKPEQPLVEQILKELRARKDKQ
jgi:hypothetical protein